MLDLVAKLFPKQSSSFKIGERVTFTTHYLENAGFDMRLPANMHSDSDLDRLVDRIERLEHSRFHSDMIVVRVSDDLGIVQISYRSMYNEQASGYKMMTFAAKDLRSLNERLTYEELLTHPDKEVREIVLKISNIEYG